MEIVYSDSKYLDGMLVKTRNFDVKNVLSEVKVTASYDYLVDFDDYEIDFINYSGEDIKWICHGGWS